MWVRHHLAKKFITDHKIQQINAVQGGDDQRVMVSCSCCRIVFREYYTAINQGTVLVNAGAEIG
jgi:hypothetical protein